MNSPLQTCVNVRMNRDGAVSRRGFLRRLAAGAPLSPGCAGPIISSACAGELKKQGELAFCCGWPAALASLRRSIPSPAAETQGPTKAIATSVPGLQIAEHWTRTAEVMKEFAVIRSMTSKEGNHGRATYLLHTSYPPSGGIVHPGFGSHVAMRLGDADFDLPHFVSISGQSVGPSFLDIRYAPFVVTDPNKPPDNLLPLVEQGSLQSPARTDEGTGKPRSLARGRPRWSATIRRSTTRRPSWCSARDTKAFNLDQESDRIRDLYGRSTFGQGCLMARRLIEAGVTFVEVQSSGWDTHGNELASSEETDSAGRSGHRRHWWRT